MDKWVFSLVEERPHRLVFAFPWKRVFVVASIFWAIGAAGLHPFFEDKLHQFFRWFVSGGALVFAGYLTVISLGSKGELILDAISRVARLRWESPWHQVSWTKPFQEIRHVQFRQIVDQHGLHNHWRIELLLKDGQAIRLGYGLLGAIRRSAAESLVKKVSTLADVPIHQLGKTQAFALDRKHS